MDNGRDILQNRIQVMNTDSKERKIFGYNLTPILVIVLTVIALAAVGRYAFLYSNNNSPHATKNEETSKTNEPSQLAEIKSFQISEWRLKALPSKEVTLKYVPKANGTGMNFSSKELIASSSSPGCGVDNDKHKGGGVILRLTGEERLPLPPGDDIPAQEFASKPGSNEFYAKLSDYYYIFLSPQGPCDGSDSVVKLQEQTINAVKELIKSFEAY